MGDIQLTVCSNTDAPWVRPLAWRFAQVIVWLVGLAMFLLLIFAPKLGLHVFWDGLIPLAPALFVFTPGLWRNICPLASSALLPRHMGWSRQIQVTRIWQGRFMLIGTALLFGFIPLRHVVLNTSGLATAGAITFLAIIAVVSGFVFEWKSGWCAGMCPVYQVEKLYGSASPTTFTNAHCIECHRCVASCPDSIPNPSPLDSRITTRSELAVGFIMVGAFPGLVWSWFQQPSITGNIGLAQITDIYATELLWAGVSLVLFLLLRQFVVPSRGHQRLNRLFAAASVSCYYWYRFPVFFGLDANPTDAMLIDLSGLVASDMIPTVRTVMQISCTALFVWVLAGRANGRGTWLKRPPFARGSVA